MQILYTFSASVDNVLLATWVTVPSPLLIPPAELPIQTESELKAEICMGLLHRMLSPVYTKQLFCFCIYMKCTPWGVEWGFPNSCQRARLCIQADKFLTLCPLVGCSGVLFLLVYLLQKSRGLHGNPPVMTWCGCLWSGDQHSKAS